MRANLQQILLVHGVLSRETVHENEYWKRNVTRGNQHIHGPVLPMHHVERGWTMRAVRAIEWRVAIGSNGTIGPWRGSRAHARERARNQKLQGRHDVPPGVRLDRCWYRHRG